MITLTPLASSASSSSTSEPIAYFLELDNARILLDMGQRDYRANGLQGNWEYEEKIRELAPTLSLVLLSHSPANYLGLYPYARAHWGLKCPVYATKATVEMGRIVCLAEAGSWRAEHDVPEAESSLDAQEGVVATSGKGKQPLRGPFVATVKEIYEAFAWIKSPGYNQPVHLGGDLSHLLLTPFPSGHVLGGTLFKIRSATSGTVLYAVGMNHMGDRHLDGMMTGQGGLAGYAEDIKRPDLLIVEGGRSLVVNAKRKDRETCILDIVTSTLTSGNSVLMPCDPSPRLLELLVLLDQHWTFKKNPGNGPRARTAWDFPLCLVSATAREMMLSAKTLVEWMGGVVRESGAEDSARRRKNRRHNDMSETSLLDFVNVNVFSSITELLQAFPLNRPKLVLAIPPTMSYGPSRFLFTAMASQPGNVILLTNRGEDETLTRDLYTRWEKGQDKTAKWGQGKIGELKSLKGKMTLEVNSKVALEGAELEAWEEEERLKKEREAAHQAAVDRSRRMLEADDLESDSDSDGEGEGDGARGGGEGANAYAADGDDARTMSYDIFVKGQQTRVGRTAAGELARFRMFPYIAKTRRVDSYGEGLDIGQWLRKGREIEEEGETEEVRDAKRRKLEEEEKQAQVAELPSKFVSQDVTVKLAASVEYVDMDGMYDGQALKTIIAQLQPRKMIVINSTDKATDATLEFAKTSSIPDVFRPGTNEPVTIGGHIASYTVQLGDSIRSLLDSKWSKFEGYEVAMVDAQLAYATGSTVPMLEGANVVLPPLQPEAKDEPEPDVTAEPATEDTEDDKAKAKAEEEAESKAEEGTESKAEEDAESKAEETAEANGETEPEEIKTENTVMDIETVKEEPVEVKSVTPPPSGPGALPSSLFIGDLRLNALKTRLASQSIGAAFAGEGVLVCGTGINSTNDKARGSVVVVRKLGEGRVVLEGAVSATYFAVRKELYSSYAQVTTV